MGIYTATGLPSDGDSIDAADVTTDLNGLISEFNGNIDNTNIKASAAIAFSKLAADAWTAYTPTLVGITLGNGSLSGKYIKIGRKVELCINFTAGSTTTFGGAVFTFSLPFTASDTKEKGIAQVLDASPGSFYCAVAHKGTTTTVEVYTNQSLQACDADYPFTWTTNDSIALNLTYESAS